MASSPHIAVWLAPTIAGRLPDRFLATGMPTLRPAGVAALASWKTEMAKVTETVAKLGAFDTLAKLTGTSSPLATLAAQNRDLSASLAEAIAPAAAVMSKVSTSLPQDFASPRHEGNWIQVPPNPVPSILRELHAELAQANAAETARADAAEKRAAVAEAQAERAERLTVISVWLSVGMFVLTMATLIVAMVA